MLALAAETAVKRVLAVAARIRRHVFTFPDSRQGFALRNC
jgi:hypothetical protein